MSIVSLHHVSYVTPEGKALITDLDLSFSRARTGVVGRNGVGKSTLLKLIMGMLQPMAGSVVTNGVLRLLNQDVGADPVASVASIFGVESTLQTLIRALNGEAEPDDIAKVDWTLEGRLLTALESVGLGGVEPGRRLASLSGGQRTRVALAALTFDQPDMILLDEPTNNLDQEGRALVANMLDGWKGGAIVVSHDRALLRHVDCMVELSTLGARRYDGNFDAYATRRADERAAAHYRLDRAERQARQVDQRLQAEKETKAKKDAAGRRQRASGSQGKLLLNAQKGRAEKTQQRSQAMAERLKENAARELVQARANVERLETLRIDLPRDRLPVRKVILHLDHISAGYDRKAPVIRDLSLSIIGPERVAITGANGSGKTTLLRVVTGDLRPFAGEVWCPVHASMLDQQAAILRAESTIVANFKRLNPNDNDNACRAALARFLFRADAALQRVDRLSGGERLRAGLSCVLGGTTTPELLILDEPTNHLDLDSIAAIESGLNSYGGALLVVSHDEEFLAAIGTERIIELRRSS